jgi:hypothetical protein
MLLTADDDRMAPREPQRQLCGLCHQIRGNHHLWHPHVVCLSQSSKLRPTRLIPTQLLLLPPPPPPPFAAGLLLLQLPACQLLLLPPPLPLLSTSFQVIETFF